MISFDRRPKIGRPSNADCNHRLRPRGALLREPRFLFLQADFVQSTHACKSFSREFRRKISAENSRDSGRTESCRFRSKSTRKGGQGSTQRLRENCDEDGQNPARKIRRKFGMVGPRISRWPFSAEHFAPVVIAL